MTQKKTYSAHTPEGAVGSDGKASAVADVATDEKNGLIFIAECSGSRKYIDSTGWRPGIAVYDEQGSFLGRYTDERIDDTEAFYANLKIACDAVDRRLFVLPDRSAGTIIEYKY